MVCKTPANHNSTRAWKFSISATNINPIEDIVQDYITYHRKRSADELSYYQDLSLEKAIKHAASAICPGRSGCRGNKKYSHQWHIKNTVLNQSAQTLLAQTSYEKIEKGVSSFDALMKHVNKTIRGIPGIGELAVYDTALRIGANKNLEPKQVYLHAGARGGAKALKNAGFGVEEKNGILCGELPIEFEALKPHEIEECLCLYRKVIDAIAS